MMIVSEPTPMASICAIVSGMYRGRLKIPRNARAASSVVSCNSQTARVAKFMEGEMNADLQLWSRLCGESWSNLRELGIALRLGLIVPKRFKSHAVEFEAAYHAQIRRGASSVKIWDWRTAFANSGKSARSSE